MQQKLASVFDYTYGLWFVAWFSCTWIIYLHASVISIHCTDLILSDENATGTV